MSGRSRIASTASTCSYGETAQGPPERYCRAHGTTRATTPEPSPGPTCPPPTWTPRRRSTPTSSGGTTTTNRFRAEAPIRWRGGRPCCRRAQRRAGRGQPPAWTAYVTVDDADATVRRPPSRRDAPRRAVRRDGGGPHGGHRRSDRCGLRRLEGRHVDRRRARQRPRPALAHPAQHIRPDRATEFYSELFGWRVDATEGTETPTGASIPATA